MTPEEVREYYGTDACSNDLAWSKWQLEAVRCAEKLLTTVARDAMDGEPFSDDTKERVREAWGVVSRMSVLGVIDEKRYYACRSDYYACKI